MLMKSNHSANKSTTFHFSDLLLTWLYLSLEGQLCLMMHNTYYMGPILHVAHHHSGFPYPQWKFKALISFYLKVRITNPYCPSIYFKSLYKGEEVPLFQLQLREVAQRKVLTAFPVPHSSSQQDQKWMQPPTSRSKMMSLSFSHF